jgi:ribonuclease PH
MARSYKRSFDQLRPLKISCDISDFADGSVILQIGKTKVLCAVSLSNNLPIFLRGKSKWWLTASYALLPTSTKYRVERESHAKRNERSVEISRLIGRSLRSVVKLNDMATEKTIHIDCDVIQADAGTRTACITGAFVALKLAEKHWLAHGLITAPIIQEDMAAVSVGLVNDQPLLDIDFAEDSNAQADFNFILTRTGKVIELQCSAEQHPIAWEWVSTMKDLAQKGVQELLTFIDQNVTFQRAQSYQSIVKTSDLF